MKTLQLQEMEQTNGGMPCGEAFQTGATIAGLGATFGGMVGGSLGLVVFASLMIACD